jgi:hypothetical protein
MDVYLYKTGLDLQNHWTLNQQSAIMRFEPTVFLSLFGATAAHYTFNSLILNGQITPQWQYVRRHNRGIDPTRGVDRANVASVHFRCNLDALSAGPSTQVAAVSPGQR